MAVIRYFQKKNESFYITEFGYSAPQQRKQVPTRVRDVYLLHIVLSGVCHFSAFDAPAGNAFLICKGKPNSFTVEPGYVHYWFGFDGNDASRLLATAGIPYAQHALQHIKGFPGFVSALLSEAHRYQGLDGDAVARGAFQCILSLIGDSERNTKTDVETAKEFMDSNYHRRLSMEFLAEYVHLSEKHLCRKFSAAFGVAPLQYLLKLRMEKACSLLVSTDLKIKEIAFSVGYSSQLQFSAMFKKQYGVSPVDYRKQINNQP